MISNVPLFYFQEEKLHLQHCCLKLLPCVSPGERAEGLATSLKITSISKLRVSGFVTEALL